MAGEHLKIWTLASLNFASGKHSSFLLYNINSEKKVL